MGSYVESTLLKGETVLYLGRKSLWNYAVPLLLGVLVSISCVPLTIGLVSARDLPARSFLGALTALWWLLGIVLIAWPLILRRTTECAVTNRRVIVKTGVLATSSLEIRFEKIETVRVQQGVLGRIFGYGDVDIRGTGSTFDPITSISNPQAFKANLDQAMNTDGAAPG